MLVTHCRGSVSPLTALSQCGKQHHIGSSVDGVVGVNTCRALFHNIKPAHKIP